jgi:hypothetical protein
MKLNAVHFSAVCLFLKPIQSAYKELVPSGKNMRFGEGYQHIENAFYSRGI